MKLRHRFLIVFGVGHLILVASGALGWLKRPPQGPTENIVQIYSAASGADNGYGFFAPGVGAQFRTIFILQDKDGREWRENLKLGTTSEANLRFTGISSQLADMPPPVRHRVMSSFAGMMFGKYPNARKITVRLELYGFDRSQQEADFPTMAEFRAGVRPNWLPILDATFLRDDIKRGIPSTETQIAQK
ncbi:MAG: hypothetical protein Tsb009_36050 [Planctomycetaceae bacterium]